MRKTGNKGLGILRIGVVLLSVTAMLLSWATPSYAATTATVCLVDSMGNGIPGALAEFRSGTWQTIGFTGADGCVGTDSSAALGNRRFRVTYNGQTEQKTQDTTINPVVTFTTILVTGQLLDSTGTGIEGAVIQYNAAGWKTLGTTDATGQTSAEMLPASRRFRVTYNGQTEQKTQDTTINPVVSYLTGRVLQGTGARVLRYRASGWQPFFDGIELLPGDVVFDLDVGPNETHTVTAGSSVYVPVAPTPPVVAPGSDVSGDEGAVIMISGSYTDVEIGQTHTATIEWGDGSPVDSGVITAADGLGGLVVGSHAYADEGVYPVTLCVTDNGNPDATGCASLQATVANVAPLVSILGQGSAYLGTEVTLTAQVTDPGWTDSAGYYWAVTLSGEVVAGGSVAELIFTPASIGEHVIALTVDDGDGGTASTEMVLTVIAAEEPEEPPLEPPVEDPEPVAEIPEPAEDSPDPESAEKTFAPGPEDPKDSSSGQKVGESGQTQSEDPPYPAAEVSDDHVTAAFAEEAGFLPVPAARDEVESSYITPDIVARHQVSHVDGGLVSPTSWLLLVALISLLLGMLAWWERRRG